MSSSTNGAVATARNARINAAARELCRIRSRSVSFPPNRAVVSHAITNSESAMPALFQIPKLGVQSQPKICFHDNFPIRVAKAQSPLRLENAPATILRQTAEQRSCRRARFVLSGPDVPDNDRQ